MSTVYDVLDSILAHQDYVLNILNYYITRGKEVNAFSGKYAVAKEYLLLELCCMKV